MNRFSSRGISLIELVIYIGILSFVMVILADLFSGVLRTKSLTDSKVEVASNLRFAADRMTGEIRKASSASVSACSGGLNTLTLVIASVTKTFSVTAGGVVQFNDGTAKDITSSLVKVVDPGSGGCLFSLVTNSAPAKNTVQIILKIQYDDKGRPTLQYSDSIKTTVSLR